MIGKKMMWIYYKFCLKNLILYYHHFSVKKRLKKRLINPVNELNKVVVQQRNKKLIRRYFRFQGLTDMQRKLYNTKNKDRNKDLVNVIKSRFADLQN